MSASRGDFVGPVEHRDLAHLHEIHADRVVDVRFRAALFRQMLQLVVALDRRERFVRMLIIAKDEIVIGDGVAMVVILAVGGPVCGGNAISGWLAIQLTIQLAAGFPVGFAVNFAMGFSIQAIRAGTSPPFLKVVESKWSDVGRRMHPAVPTLATERTEPA